MHTTIKKLFTLFLASVLGCIVTCVFFSNAHGQERSSGKAVSAYMEGNYSEAESFVDLGTEVETDLEMSYVVDGFLLIRKEKYSEAIDLLRPCYWDKAEGNKRQYCLLAGMYSAYMSQLSDGYGKESDVAGNTLNKIKGILKKIQPKTAFEYYLRSFAHNALDNKKEYQADLNKAIQLNPRFVLAYLRRGDSFLADNQAQALADYQKAMQINPKCPSVYSYRSYFYSIQKNHDLAIADYTKAIELEPDNEFYYNNRGNAYRWSNQNELALRDYNKSIELNPKYAEPYVNRGIIYLYGTKQEDLAIADFMKSLNLRKGNPWANYFLGVMRIWNNKYRNLPEAVDKLQAAIKQDPSLKDAYFQLGVAHTQRQGFPDDALKALNKAIELMPEKGESYFYRGVTKRDLGDYEGAIADYSKYLGVNSKDAGAYYNRAYVYFQDVQKFDLAIVDFTKAIEINPKYWDAYFSRANVYESMGNQAAADADYKKLKDTKNISLVDYKKYVKYLYPNATFDAALAQNLLNSGSSTIAGRACAYEANTKFDARNTKVLLYPVTPYLEAWYALRKKQEDKTTVVYVSKEAARHRREAVTNEEGMFVFDNIKPGRYFIQVIFNFSRAWTKRHDAGSNTEVVNGVLTTTNYYYDQDYQKDYSKRLEEFVDVKTEGEVTKVDLKKGWGGILAKGCSRPF